MGDSDLLRLISLAMKTFMLLYVARLVAMVVSYKIIYFLGLVSVGKSSITSLEYGDSEKTWWAIVYVCRNILSFVSSQIFQNIVKMYFRYISNGRNVWPERKNGGHNKPHCAQETAASTRKGLACVS